MMLRDRQNKIFEILESNGRDFSKISNSGNFEEDDRLCLTIVSFLGEPLKSKILNEIIIPLKKEDPSQYYYLPESLHLTIQNIKIVNEPPNFTEKDMVLLTKMLHGFKLNQLNFDLSGLFIMPGSFAIRAYPDNETHKSIMELRRKLAEARIHDDKKYADETTFIGNITLSRFYQKPNAKFLKKFREIRNTGFGSIIIDEIFLIKTNLVCAKNKTKIIASFGLRHQNL